MSEPLFLPAPFFFLRSPRWAIEDWQKILENPGWMEGVFSLYESDPFFQEAIAIASPSLHWILQKKEKRKESTAISLLNYALRMATRSIPFGLFSFVAYGSWGQNTEIFFNLDKVSKRIRPDMAWIYAFVQTLYQEQDSFSHLEVHTNPLIRITAERVFLDYALQAEKKDPEPSKIFSIRATRLVKETLLLAKKPIALGRLCDELLAQIDTLEREKVFAVIRNLFSQQFLVPSILPSLLSFSPFQDLIASLPTSSALTQIAKEMNKPTTVLELQKMMKAQAPAKTFLQIESVYRDAPLKLHKNIGEELASAAKVLWKISPAKALPSSLQVYHGKFLEKYGTHRTVPLLEMLSEEKGLGSFENIPPIPRQPSPFTVEWEKWLHRKWQECLQTETHEILFSEEIVDQLYAVAKQTPHDPRDALLSTDLFCKVIAENTERIDRGHFQLLFVQPTWQGGNSIGRFVDLFDERFQKQFRQYLQGEEDLEKKVLFVETSYWPHLLQSANVAVNPCFRKHRLDLQNPKGNSFSLEDIYVGATIERFYLTLKEGKSEILIRTGSLLNPLYAPTPIQFIREVSQAKYQLIQPFSWGYLKNDAIYLPRVRCGKTIFSPAQWKLDASLFKKMPKDEIPSKFNLWADQWNLPRRCFLVRSDQQLLIDRCHPAHLQEISIKLKKGESLQFTEEIGNPWAQSERGHHLCEIVVPFLKNPAYGSQNALKPAHYLSTPIEERVKLLGSEWVYFKLYQEEEGINRFLIRHLSAFAEKMHLEKKIIGWFFIRYQDPERHLRVRMRMTERKLLSELIFALNEIAKEWLSAGLIKEILFANYERELERYGGPDLIEAAEYLFCRDSLSIVYLLKCFPNKTLPGPILHTMSLIGFLKGFGLKSSEMLDILSSENRSELKGFREHRQRLVTLTEALEENVPNEEIEPFLQACEMRKKAQDYFCFLLKDFPVTTKSTILNSMLHMHCNRLGCTIPDELRARLYALRTLTTRMKLESLCRS